MQEENIYEKLSTIDLHAPLVVTVSFDDEEEIVHPFSKAAGTVDYAQSEKFEPTCKSTNTVDNNKDASDAPNLNPLVIKSEVVEILTDSNDSDNLHFETVELNPKISNPITKSHKRTLQRDNNNEHPRKRICETPTNSDGTSGKTCDSKQDAGQENVHRSVESPSMPIPENGSHVPSSKDKNELLKALLSSEVNIAEPCNVIVNESHVTPKTDKNVSLNQSIDPTIMECYKNLLKSVSQNLIQVMYARDTVENYVLNKDLGQAEIKHAWHKYNMKKFYYFSVSHNTVLNVIVPQSKNKAFINTFISNTCNLIVPTSMTRFYKINQLFSEMLDWTVRRTPSKPSEGTTEDQNNYRPAAENQLRLMRNRPTVPLQQYSTPVSDACIHTGIHMANNVNTNISCTSSTKDVQNNCLPYRYTNPSCNSNFNQQIYTSSGPPESQVSINVNPQVLAQAQQINTQVYPNYGNGYVPYSNQAPITNQEANYIQMTMNNISNEMMYQSEPRNDGRTYPTTRPQPPPYDSSRFISNYNNTYNVQAKQTFCQPPPPYSRHMLPPNPENPLYAQLGQQPIEMAQPYVQPATIENRRSMSTDSGFISPANLSSTPVPMYDGEGTMQEKKLMNTNPLIAHVTSLNPKALLLPKGSCYVCTNATHNKCVGCLDIYYCSTDCQKVDWYRHMLICKK